MNIHQMTDDQIKSDLLKAKKTGNPKILKLAITEALRPEAKLAVELANKNQTTKNGYGSILQILGSFPTEYKTLFINACILEGFDFQTAQTLQEMI